MTSSNAGLILLIVFFLIFLYALIVIFVMLVTRPTLHYRQLKYQDQGVFTRWYFIWLLLPLRICYEIALWTVKIGKILIFVLAAVLTLLLSPFYFLIYRPLARFFVSVQEGANSFEKFVEVFRSGIRLGHWVMFYPKENINAEIPRRQFSATAQNQQQIVPRSIPINEDGNEVEP
jgi:hypothetical protein